MEKDSYIPSRELTYPPDKAYLKMIFLFPRWDMLVSWRVNIITSQLPFLELSSFFLSHPTKKHNVFVFFGVPHGGHRTG